MENRRTDGREPHSKADAVCELAPHSEAVRSSRGGKCAATSPDGSTPLASATPITRWWHWPSGFVVECGCTTGNNGNAPARVAATFSPW